ncbi:MAG: WD40 repeat domain-containing protein [Candidatus Helarchaeales archaeon]
MKVWDFETGEILGKLEGHSAPVNTVAVFPDGRHVISGSRDGTVKFWDLHSGEHVNAFEEKEVGTYTIDVSCGPDGKFFVVSINSSIKIISLD